MALGGTFLVSDPPQRGGLFINVEPRILPRVRDTSRGVAAVVVKADWGPHNEVVEVTSEAQALDLFGETQTAYFTISQALAGQNNDGASVVQVYRAATPAAAKATVMIQNVTPANAMSVTALYAGDRGDELEIAVKPNALDNTKMDLFVYEGTLLRETHTHTKTDVTGFAAKINASSKFITATMLIDGVALKDTTVDGNRVLAGGDSGLVLTNTEHTNAMAALEAYGGFDTFALDDLPNDTGSLRSTYVDWADRLNSEGKLFHFVTGGPASELYTDAIDRAEALDSEFVITLYGDLNIDGTVYSSSKLASRIAGILSSAGPSRSISGSAISGATLASPPNATSIENLVRAGVIPFIRDAGDVRLQRARTTYQTAGRSNASEDFRSLAFMRRLQYTFSRFDLIVSSYITGQPISNTPTGRDAVLGLFKAELRTLEEAQVTVPGATVVLDPTQDNTGETLWLVFSYRPASGIEQILGRVSIAI